MKYPRISPFRLLGLTVAVLAGLLLVVVTMAAAQTGSVNPAQAPGGIEGFLYEPDGTTPVGGGWIDIHDLEGHPWMGAETAPDGFFSIANLSPGEYILRAYPPPGSPYASSLPQVVEVLSGDVASTMLLLTEVGISGYVRDCDAVPELRIEDALVVAHNDDWTFEQWDATNAAGEFKIGGVEVGTPYILEVFPPPESEYVPPEPIPVVPVATGLVLELCVPPINVVGTVHNPYGNPVPGAGVVVFGDDFWQETAADELGDFLFRGLPVGEFWIHAAPPWGPHGEGLIASEPFSITIVQPDTLVDVGILVLPRAFKTASGHVLNAATGAGVPDAVVVAHRLDEPGYADTPTDPTGAFALTLPGGEWHLAVEPLPPPQPPPEWIFPGPPAWVVFELPPTEPETKMATLEVFPTNAWVTGRVVCPDGNPCPGTPPPDAIWAELRSDEIGNGVGLGPDYRFEIPILHGCYGLLVHVDDPLLQGPEPMHVCVGPGQTLDVGDVPLLPKDARITGRVRDELGAGVAGVPVAGWQPEGFGWGWAETDASGAYSMPVIGGEWFVEPQPGPDLPFVFRQHPQLVRVAPGGTMAGVDFTLTFAGARIEGEAVDAGSYERLWGLDGWASAHILPSEEFFSDAPMWDGGFGLKVRGGEQYNVGLGLPPHAPYVSGGTGPVSVPSAAHVPVAVPLEHKNAAIEGRLVIAGTPDPALGVWAEVFGEDEQGHWAVAGVDPDSAGYELGVISGTWHLRAWVDPASGYVAMPTPVVVTVQSHQVASFVDFEVWPINSLINGHVFQPDGTPLPGVVVFAEGESPHVGHFEAHVESDENGYYELLVPEGGYLVGAALPGDELAARGWLNPRPIDVPWVSAANPAPGRDLHFRRLDGEIHGTVTFAPGIAVSATHSAYVWGWADTGEWAETEAVVAGPNTFTYVMQVVSDTVWHVGAVYEDWDNGVFYESPEETVHVLPPSGQATQDLELGGPWPLPQPIIVTFDGSYMTTIVLPDGVALSIPPGALVVSGTVTMFIFPTQELRPEPGQEIVGVGYEMWAIDQNGQEITHFNQNVVMTFHYPPDVDLEALGISE
ncbi:MAG: carboxypeptidase regulatory-like domain-containing protein, partial [Anaerolineae bacterium]